MRPFRTIAFLTLLSVVTMPRDLAAQPAPASPGAVQRTQEAMRGDAAEQLHRLTMHPAKEAAGTLSPRDWPAGVPKIGLVLSGGGSRGFSQIGVLKVIEELHIPVYAVVGTSIGGVVGGLYADGYTAGELDSIVRATDWDGVLGYGDEQSRDQLFVDQKIENDRSLLTLRLDGLKPVLPEAISIGSRITQFVERLVWGGPYHGTGSFDNLKYHYRAVATNLVNGRIAVLDSGNLALAMRASATVPLRFSPVRMDSMLLVDGGLVDNIPVDVARAMGCDRIIVVNTTSPLLAEERLNSPWSVADQVVTLMMRHQSDSSLAGADVVITPDLAGMDGADFSNPGAAIDSGEAAARRAINALKTGTAPVTVPGAAPNPPPMQTLSVECSDPRLLASLDYSDMQAHVDLAELQRHLDHLGATGTFNDVAADVRYSEVGARIRLTGDPAPAIVAVAFQGLGAIPDSIASCSFRALVGKPLDNDSLRAAAEASVRTVRHAGYAFFRIDSTSVGGDPAVLHVYVNQGAIRSVSFVGLEQCAPFVVERELELAPGEIFTADAARRSANALMHTGYFNDARIDPVQRPDGDLDVVVRVKERSTAILRLSASVDNERYTQVGVELAQENLFGQGTRLGGSFWGGLRDRYLVADLRANRIYGTYWTFGLSSYAGFRNVNSFSKTVDQQEGVIRRNIIGEYREYRVGARARFGRQIGRIGVLNVEGRYERQGTTDLTVHAADVTWRGLATVKLGTRFDTQDRVPFTRDGGVLDVSYETSQSVFGADQSFAKLSIDADYFSSFGRRSTLHPRLRLGFADATLPLMEQFTLGGERSMYGLREDEARGRQLFLASMEYRYLLPVRVYFDTYFALRYDLGSTWGTPSEIRLKDLEHGLGMQLSLDTPLGPASFAVGRSFIFNKSTAPTLVNWGPFVAYFSLGYRFE
ncbi:MAG: BamA/TamA family outer membrane protein [Bacteroidetes bacterium]|nr:BamA/TamA family outer membrane protein [Bacteroidota bacterium]